jgi:hypothetical protein
MSVEKFRWMRFKSKVNVEVEVEVEVENVIKIILAMGYGAQLPKKAALRLVFGDYRPC